jgi:hypothetical protein
MNFGRTAKKTVSPLGSGLGLRLHSLCVTGSKQYSVSTDICR